MVKSPPEARAALVAALRSGDYVQGQHYLTRRYGAVDYDCCLGVACKLAIEDGVNVTETYYEDENLVAYGHQRRVLPSSVQYWLGFTVPWGEFRPFRQRLSARTGSPHFVMSLSAANDEGVSFDHIADAIETGAVVCFDDAY